ncbi:hypothetical protein [Megasphaera sp.]|jgi:chemotaxis protein histidine kinase CheA|uniref:hypothetical protein n=1 Tax=Megasphaera sp. TaxID=2023260 RepID=UPI003F80EB99
MKRQAFQPGEIRDEQDNIIRPGAYGKNTALATSDNTGILDYIINNFQALFDMISGACVYVEELPISGDTDKLYVVKSTGKTYRWDGKQFILVSEAVDGLSAYEIAKQNGFTGTEKEWLESFRGEKGDQGEKGESITGATVDSDGYLMLNLSSGQSIKTELKPIIEAKQYADNAGASAIQARESEMNAATYADNANESKTAAKTSEVNAKASEKSAKSSEEISLAKAEEALASATSASNSATNASESELNSAKSAERAEDSYNKTASIQSDFQVILDTAKASETNASNSAKEAKTSEIAAATSASNASTSAEKAKASETNAANSESNALQYKDSALESKTASANSESNASKSEINAKASMNAASASATSASTSATNASVSEGHAATSETNAKQALAESQRIQKEVESALTKVTGFAKYAGSVDNYSDLPLTGTNTGDVWNVVNADATHQIKAGDNVIWNGKGWDNLSGFVDLSNYPTNKDVAKAIVDTTYSGGTITFIHKDGTKSTATIGDTSHAIQADQDGEGNVIADTYYKKADASTIHQSFQNQINSKQDKLTFDKIPTAGSTNPVTSDGVRKAIDEKTVDLSNYYTKAQVNTAVSTAKTEIEEKIPAVTVSGNTISFGSVTIGVD